MSEQSQTMQLNPVSSSLLSGKSSGVADAWLFQYAPSRYVAFPLKTCQEIIENPKILSVPSIASFGLGLLFWREQWIPLVDLNALLFGHDVYENNKQTLSHCLIVAYRQADGNIDYVAVALPFFPHLLQVSDTALCALPTDHPVWKKVAVSCFRYQNRRVPIIDSSRLFTP